MLQQRGKVEFSDFITDLNQQAANEIDQAYPREAQVAG
jgi:hypothetical protein